MTPLLLLLAALGIGAHPTHTSSALVREAPGGAQVTVRVFRDDLARVARGSGAVAAYVRRTFTLADASGRPLPLAVGAIRAEGDAVVIEGTVTGSLAGGFVRHGVLCDVFDDQVNVVRLAGTGRSRTVLFRPGDGPKRLE
jgi:hypothetical protein